MRKRFVRVVAGVAMLSIVAAACGSSSNKGSSNTQAPSQSSVNPADVPNGGTLTIGAEQEPDCFDWVGSCGGSTWGFWMGQVATMPSAVLPIEQPDGTYKNEPSPVLTKMPTVTSTPVETITYDINPKAVWSDGVKMSCDDFKYTWEQVAKSSDIYDTTGYIDIANVDCKNEAQPVVTFKQGKTFATWEQLFGGGYGFMPAHILQGKDRDAAMKNGYPWSGGPWIAKWTKGDNITLTPNGKYWGPKPKLDKVVFKIEADTAAEFQAFKSGQVQAIYPQPQPDVVDAIAGGQLPSGAHHLYDKNSASTEAIWMNSSHFPFTDKNVRLALAYAIDRDAIVKQLFGKLGVTSPWNSLNVPIIASDYGDVDAFKAYHLDLSKVDSLMKGAGFAKGSDGIWAKGGKRTSFGLSTTQGNKRRQLTVEALQQELKQAGFEVKLVFRSVADLFGKDAPQGNFDTALFASTLTAFTPGICSFMCTKNIPGPSNNNAGQNWYRYSNPKADTPLATVDGSLDTAKQMAAGKEADGVIAQDVPALPIDPLPQIALWSDKLVGPVSNNAILGMFWNLDKLGCAGGSCS